MGDGGEIALSEGQQVEDARAVLEVRQPPPRAREDHIGDREGRWIEMARVAHSATQGASSRNAQEIDSSASFVRWLHSMMVRG